VLIIALFLSAVYSFWNPGSQVTPTKVAMNDFVTDVESGTITEVKVADNRISYTLADKTEKYTFKEYGETLDDVLKEVDPTITKNLPVEIVDTSGSGIWWNIASILIPVLLAIGFLYFIMRGAANSNNQAMSFGKSSARLHDKEKEKTTFADVAGVQEAKDELLEIVDFLKNPSKYTSMGAKIPKGVLLIGGPGTGKTLLARAVAGEANVPFFSISGSEFVEMFVGVGASRVRDLFKKAKRNAPCIIFMDEIDAVGRQRGAGMGGGHDEREQTLNQILTEMDGFETNTGVIVMAATNRPDVLDPALLRPGRFDRRVVVDSPNMDDREAILRVHSKNKPLASDADLKGLARQTSGFSGADLENVMNEAAITAARNNSREITSKFLTEAIEKVQMGPERKSRVLNEKEKEITAYHETGHAIVGYLLSECDHLRKITIISRGLSLGSTWFMPEEDKHIYNREKFEHEMASLMGGYATEKMIFGQVSTGPSNDLERATDMARRMVTEYGMSAKIGPTVFGEKNHEVFLGRDFGHVKNYSEEKAAQIDSEIEILVETALKTASDLLTSHRKELDAVAKALIERETLSLEEFVEIFEGRTSKTTAKAKTHKKMTN
jgi:cell division protease FtsH